MIYPCCCQGAESQGQLVWAHSCLSSKLLTNFLRPTYSQAYINTEFKFNRFMLYPLYFLLFRNIRHSYQEKLLSRTNGSTRIVSIAFYRYVFGAVIHRNLIKSCTAQSLTAYQEIRCNFHYKNICHLVFFVIILLGWPLLW